MQIPLNQSCFWHSVHVFNHLSLRSAATLLSFSPSICQKGTAFIIIDVFARQDEKNTHAAIQRAEPTTKETLVCRKFLSDSNLLAFASTWDLEKRQVVKCASREIN